MTHDEQRFTMSVGRGSWLTRENYTTVYHPFHTLVDYSFQSHDSDAQSVANVRTLRMRHVSPFQSKSVFWPIITFLPRDAMRKCGLWCGPVSVRQSATFVHSIQTAEDIVKLLYRPGSPIILVLWPPAPIPNSKGIHGAQNTRGLEKLRFSTEIAIYLGNGTR